ncbi:MAG: bifunctional nuclease family protein [Actinobacteria bacterium]|nr:bifunctional nuclease family protein [Actinomycetota bacterium]
MLEMIIHSVNIDLLTNQPVLILKDKEGKRFLPIWIGQHEATSILIEMQGVKFSRPLTHDLLKNMIDALNVQLSKIVINDIDNGTFFARIFVEKNSSEFEIDARPSDAIALAIRAGGPIFASDKVIEKTISQDEKIEEKEIEKFREFLENIEPEDFKQ